MVSIACVRACTRRRIDRCCGGRATRAAFVGARGLLLRLCACVAFVFDVVAEVDVELFVTGKRAQHVQTPSRLDVAVAVALTSGSVASTTCVARYQHDVFFWYQRQSGVAACCARQQYGGGIYVKKKVFFSFRPCTVFATTDSRVDAHDGSARPRRPISDGLSSCFFVFRVLCFLSSHVTFFPVPVCFVISSLTLPLRNLSESKPARVRIVRSMVHTLSI